MTEQEKLIYNWLTTFQRWINTPQIKKERPRKIRAWSKRYWYNRQYRVRNKEKISAYNRAYREKEKLKEASYQKQWRAKNPDKVKEY